MLGGMRKIQDTQRCDALQIKKARPPIHPISYRTDVFCLNDRCSGASPLLAENPRSQHPSSVKNTTPGPHGSRALHQLHSVLPPHQWLPCGLLPTPHAPRERTLHQRLSQVESGPPDLAATQASACSVSRRTVSSTFLDLKSSGQASVQSRQTASKLPNGPHARGFRGAR